MVAICIVMILSHCIEWCFPCVRAWCSVRQLVGMSIDGLMWRNMSIFLPISNFFNLSINSMNELASISSSSKCCT